MSDYYPPGVTGREPQIAGDAAWDDLNDWLCETGLEPHEIKACVNALQGIANPQAVAGLVEALECSSRVIMQCPDAPYRDEQLAQNAAAIAALEQEQSGGEHDQ